MKERSLSITKKQSGWIQSCTARDDVKCTFGGSNLSGQIDLVVSHICHCLFLRSQGWCLGYTMDYADVDFKASVWNKGCPEGIGFEG